MIIALSIWITKMRLCLAFILLWNAMDYALARRRMDCYTCSVDFRSEPYEQNNSCLFPRNPKGRTHCSDESKYCQGIITRINGVFVQLQRTCETDCEEFCTEKGFGIETSECRFCCNSTYKRGEECGFQGYRSNAHLTEFCLGWLMTYFMLLTIYDYIKNTKMSIF